MATSNHKQAHYFQVLQLFALAVVITAIVAMRDDLSPIIITGLALIYFAANVAHSIKTHSLTVVRVIELGLIAIVSEFLILSYLI